jgi:hypothetical protein
MKLSTTLLALPLLFAFGVAAEAACTYPQAPQTLPNGAQATKEEMLAAQAVVKDYKKNVEEVYLPCLEQEKTAAVAALDNMDPEYTAKMAAIESVHAKKHNAALDELTALVNRWAEERKAYTAAQTK